MMNRRNFLVGMALVPFAPVLGTLRTLATLTAAPDHDNERLLTTDGEIAVVNLDSARRRAWSRFFQDPLRQGAAEAVIEYEQLTMQFVGDLFALDRLESLVTELVRVDAASARTALIEAQVASMAHRFADARRHLAEAERRAAPPEGVNRLRLSVDQACGANLSKVLDQRREIARRSGRSEDLVALSALLADLGEFADAERTYQQAPRGFRDVSPFPVSWIWFQRGVLWGERVPKPDKDRAAGCYRRAIEHLPAYTNARVHLAEIYLFCGRADQAEAMLIPVASRGDPAVAWRLADAMVRQGRVADAEAHIAAAHSGFQSLLERHLLAFADHGADFYAGSGNDIRKALDLARVNVANRPTLRAFEQAHAIAISADDGDAASEILADATRRWGATPAFRVSSLARQRPF
jgi:tetratricopeptide (TPR) repeat protein